MADDPAAGATSVFENAMLRYKDFDLNGKTPSEMEQRRRDIIASLTTTYRGYDDPEVPLELLSELALITSTLRRKNAGPPKVSRPRQRPTIDDL